MTSGRRICKPELRSAQLYRNQFGIPSNQTIVANGHNMYTWAIIESVAYTLIPIIGLY